MYEIDRLNGSTDWTDVDLDFVQRERTPERIADVRIRSRSTVPSLPNTKQYFESSGVGRSYDRVQKAELRSIGDATPDRVAVDETVIQVNDGHHRPYTAIDSRRTNFRTCGSPRREKRSAV